MDTSGHPQPTIALLGLDHLLKFIFARNTATVRINVAAKIEPQPFPPGFTDTIGALATTPHVDARRVRGFVRPMLFGTFDFDLALVTCLLARLSWPFGHTFTAARLQYEAEDQDQESAHPQVVYHEPATVPPKTEPHEFSMANNH